MSIPEGLGPEYAYRYLEQVDPTLQDKERISGLLKYLPEEDEKRRVSPIQYSIIDSRETCSVVRGFIETVSFDTTAHKAHRYYIENLIGVMLCDSEWTGKELKRALYGMGSLSKREFLSALAADMGAPCTDATREAERIFQMEFKPYYEQIGVNPEETKEVVKLFLKKLPLYGIHRHLNGLYNDVVGFISPEKVAGSLLSSKKEEVLAFLKTVEGDEEKLLLSLANDPFAALVFIAREKRLNRVELAEKLKELTPKDTADLNHRAKTLFTLTDPRLSRETYISILQHLSSVMTSKAPLFPGANPKKAHLCHLLLLKRLGLEKDSEVMGYVVSNFCLGGDEKIRRRILEFINEAPEDVLLQLTRLGSVLESTFTIYTALVAEGGDYRYARKIDAECLPPDVFCGSPRNNKELLILNGKKAGDFSFPETLLDQMGILDRPLSAEEKEKLLSFSKPVAAIIFYFQLLKSQNEEAIEEYREVLRLFLSDEYTHEWRCKGAPEMADFTPEYQKAWIDAPEFPRMPLEEYPGHTLGSTCALDDFLMMGTRTGGCLDIQGMWKHNRGLLGVIKGTTLLLAIYDEKGRMVGRSRAFIVVRQKEQLPAILVESPYMSHSKIPSREAQEHFIRFLKTYYDKKGLKPPLIVVGAGRHNGKPFIVKNAATYNQYDAAHFLSSEGKGKEITVYGALPRLA